MVNEVKDIRIYKILLEDIDDKIKIIETNEDKLFVANRELKALNNKHSGLYFALAALGFTLLCFVLLRMIYVLIPKEFPYYFLSFIPGIIIEYILRNKFIENEKKHTEKSLKSQIKTLNDTIETTKNDIIALIPVIREAKKKLTNLTDITTDNIQALNYITRNENEYNKVSFEARYQEFINKINNINEERYPELIELKNNVLKYNDNTIYRNLVINNLKEKENKENEKNNNPVSNTEKE